jgi:LPS export ABC transporter permease LptG
VAREGTITVLPDGSNIRLDLFNGETHSRSRQSAKDYFVARFQKQVIFMKNVDSELRRTNSSFRGDREMTTVMMQREIADFKTRQNNINTEFNTYLDTLMAAAADLQTRSARFLPDTTARVSACTTFTQWQNALRPALPVARDNISRRTFWLDRVISRRHYLDLRTDQYLVEIYKKYSIPVTTVIFVLIGAPLGIMARRGGLSVGATYSIFFFILYWITLIGGETLADNGRISPFLAMWSGNFIVGIFGLYLVLLMVRESKGFSFSAIFLPMLKRAKNMLKLIAGRNRPVTTGFFATVKRIPSYAAQRSRLTLPWYITRQFVAYLIGILISICIVFTVIDYIANLRRLENAALDDILRFYWFYLPWIVQLVLPIAGLLAAMATVGGMAKYNELTALKAAGLSIRRITIPLLLIGVGISGAAFSLGEQVLPTANSMRKELLDRLGSGEKHVRLSLNKKSDIKTSQYRRNFYYFGSDSTLYYFENFQLNNNQTMPLMARNVWRQTMKDTRVSQRIEAASSSFNHGRWRFQNGTRWDFTKDKTIVSTFDTLSDTLLRVTPAEMVAVMHSPTEMGYWELRDFIEKARRRGENVAKYAAELNFKLATPLLGFIVVLLGISIAARMGKKGGAVLFGVGIMICFLFWIISRFALAFSQNGDLPPMVGAWLGTVLFLAVGLALYRNTSR